jgi:hypothetical protein
MEDSPPAAYEQRVVAFLDAKLAAHDSVRAR